jgi:hypothetical protein
MDLLVQTKPLKGLLLSLFPPPRTVSGLTGAELQGTLAHEICTICLLQAVKQLNAALKIDAQVMLASVLNENLY